MRYIVTVVFDWDSNKNSDDVEKHGISFERAREVFLDPLHLSILDTCDFSLAFTRLRG